ncbi:hypothetical protein RhiirC2_791674 [Rhizophagus irregularis]|uniref:RNase H type-1 domain-containing protein n=1 Tax=Rhizophagus irregularis TaxID=588596 RepID=A0A2N1MIV2_9GLOM|nr:hypothetical protein RhiirC2_791674 [Rhizophagus irregularis]
MTEGIGGISSLPLTPNSALPPVFGLISKVLATLSKSNLNVNDYIACTLALLSSTPFRLLHAQLLRLPNLSLLDGRVPLFECMSPKAFKAYHPILRKWQLFYLSQLYKDIHQSTTIPDSNNHLLDDFITMPMNDSSFYELEPCLSSSPTTKNWIVTLDEFGSPIFGKQLLVKTSRGTCSIVHWVAPTCESLPGELIKLSPCLSCAAHIPLLPSKKRNADLTLSDIENGVRLYYSKLDFAPNFSPLETIEASVIPITIESSATTVFANSPLVLSADSCYIFFTDESLINLAEAAAIYAVLTGSPRDSEVTIYTDSQTAIDGLRGCSSSIYSNSWLYYKTTNFELWAIIEQTIHSKNLIVLSVKVKAHSSNYLNDFADSLANTAHTASSSILISRLDLTSTHDFVLTYDNDIVC